MANKTLFAPASKAQPAFHGYGHLIGKDVAFERLPAEVQSYEAFERHGGELLKVPFEMLNVPRVSGKTYVCPEVRVRCTAP